MSSECVQTFEVGNVTVVKFLQDRILDEATIKHLGEELSALAESGDHPKLLLNFEDVAFLSSAALGKLISVKKKATQSKTELKLCSIRPEIFEVFRITNLDQVFDISDDEDSALRRFGS